MSKLETNTIDNISGSSTLTIGDSNTSTITLKSGATLTNFPDNTPAFHAYLSANTTLTSNSFTKVAFNTELYDTDNFYDNSTNYRFTPTTAGKYMVYSGLRYSTENNTDLGISTLALQKNSSYYTYSQHNMGNNPQRDSSQFISIPIDFNGSSDYVEIYARMYTNTGNTLTLPGSSDTGASTVNQNCFFGAFKLIGV
tara:strand:- start:16 stop:606 length:591 start_codon:yes stop_codon:yes gene_type:complete